MAVRIGDTLGRIGDIGDYPLVKSEDASYSNADKTSVVNVKDALDELYNKESDVQLVQGKDTTGIVKNGSDVEESKGYTPSPIIEGIPYFKDIIRLNETNVINNLADDDLGININIKPNIEFIWVGQFQYWDDGIPHTLVPNTVYIKYFSDITQNYAYEVKQYLGNPILPTLNQINLIPEHLRFIGMTVIVNDTKEEYWFKDGIEDNNLIKKTITPNDGTLTLKVGNKTITFSANQSTPEELEIEASDLGLGIVFTYCGISNTIINDGDETNPILINNQNHYAHAGCVVFAQDSNYVTKEFVWDGQYWNDLGYPTDLSGYKTRQGSVRFDDAKEDTNPNSDGIKFVSNVTQDTNGKIQVYKKNINTAGKDALGLVKTTSTVNNIDGLTACPIINGVPYFKQTAIADTGLYINVLRENPGTQYYYSGGDVQTVNLTKFKENDIILVPDSFNTILHCYTKSGALYSILYPNRLYKIVKHYESDKDGNIVYFAKPFGIEYQKPSVYGCEIVKNEDECEQSFNHHIEIDLAHEVNLVNITERCKLRFLLDGNILNVNSGSSYDGRFLYKEFKIIVTNNTTEDKYIYFDNIDEANNIIHNHNIPDRTLAIKASTTDVLYITITKVNSRQYYNGEIHFFVERNNLSNVLDLEKKISSL